MQTLNKDQRYTRIVVTPEKSYGCGCDYLPNGPEACRVHNQPRVRWCAYKCGLAAQSGSRYCADCGSQEYSL